MTGATRGIGRAAAEEILRRSSDVHLVVLAREASGRTFRASLGAAARAVTVVDADLADLTSLRTAIVEVRRLLDTGQVPPLRGFVGNAGVQFVDHTHATVDGYETTFAVNVLAYHVLLRGLEDRFTAPSRILITTSDTHFGDFAHTMGIVPAPRWSEPAKLARPGTFDQPTTVAAGRAAYSTSKLGVIYLVHAWSRRLPDGVDIVSYNPGLVGGTGLTRAADARDRFISGRIIPLLSLTPIVDTVRGAGRKLADAALNITPAPNGAYIDRLKETPSSKESYHPEREQELWDFLDRMNDEAVQGSDTIGA
ncbi:SDR family NAD(P)-dependent oxidoreductase [Citricoccus sp. GCM10030269]|uniref:SDR family NAD(P)-dependent oxidoreductase n=1 Tax=Citricoccus sp. GCM10030269 TaxID=3273388 RepID=UPI003622169A